MLVTGKVLGETSAEWIREIEKKKNGRLDVLALTGY
jgi:hypothetical protein